jgi:hypothetical protein
VNVVLPVRFNPRRKDVSVKIDYHWHDYNMNIKESEKS